MLATTLNFGWRHALFQAWRSTEAENWIKTEDFMNRTGLSAMLLLAVFLTACSQAPPPAPDTSAADAQAIRDAEAAIMKNIAAKDVDQTVAFWADDASVFFPNMPALTGGAAIRSAVAEMMKDPNFSFTGGATKVEVSKAGDYGYSQGTYTQTFTDPKTKAVMVEKGKYVTVFKKQADGSWKAVADINNADAPAVRAKK
jgi:ketosteroid isomerase-like protein